VFWQKVDEIKEKTKMKKSCDGDYDKKPMKKMAPKPKVKPKKSGKK
jgi:hypothetical protein